ncbi:hypothetical protein BO70DRAFT_363535 [Aspergillus heteromorphus CBS 117.55]|uniref:Rhodopsin domain-containing protein n=1 Tax=Aspergillus heteromorphus CBS 117.55 TaxID=1448321 RepID=A0A317VYL3_9EURO|nr:uncharacterized protein BO70DRAFT_363535 [Aspergillus heteromorphus CBS 117.55]PWY76980.1 hypothetical protein BO70DRAFT_363535 [Aspergillus heteromorphus CBS 117.55]
MPSKVTPTNLSPVVSIMAWLLMVISALAVFTRVGIKYVISRQLSLDDGLILVSLLFCILQSVCVANEASNGFGMQRSLIPDSHLEPLLKSNYAADMLYICSITFAKLSTLAFITFLMQRTRKIEWGIIGITVIWAITAEFAVAFQCHLPQPWDWLEGRCFDRNAWWNYFDISNLFLELIIIIFPSLLMLQTQMHWKKKVIVLTCFLTRLAVIISIVIGLVYRDRVSTEADPTLAPWSVAVCMQITQCADIVVACVPQLKPFLKGLESSGLRLYKLQGENSIRAGYYQSHGSRGKSVGQELSGLRGVSNQTTVTAHSPGWQDQWNDGQSHTSQSHIIRETREWVVEEEPVRTDDSLASSTS